MKTLKKHLRMVVITATCVTAGIAVLLVVYYYHHRDLGIKLRSISHSSGSRIHDDLNGKYTKVRLNLATGGRNGLAVYMAIPYEDLKQRTQIYKNMVKIENDLIMRVEQKKLHQLAVQKDYTLLKKIFLNIINTYLDKPVDRIYFEEFFIMG